MSLSIDLLCTMFSFFCVFYQANFSLCVSFYSFSAHEIHVTMFVLQVTSSQVRQLSRCIICLTFVPIYGINYNCNQVCRYQCGHWYDTAASEALKKWDGGHVRRERGLGWGSGVSHGKFS